FRVTDGEKVLAYSGDSAPSNALAEVARDADLFVCEATLADDTSDAEPRGHLSADEAVAAFTASGARRVLITHRPEELDLPPGLEPAQEWLGGPPLRGTGAHQACSGLDLWRRAGRPARRCRPRPRIARNPVRPTRPPTITPTGTNSQTAPSAGFGGAKLTAGARGSPRESCTPPSGAQ